jgi:hypothetical protein
MLTISSSKLTRQISSIPTTHRASTLQAISQKAHALTAQIVHVKANGQKMRDVLDRATAATAGSALQRAHFLVNRLT